MEELLIALGTQVVGGMQRRKAGQASELKQQQAGLGELISGPGEEQLDPEGFGSLLSYLQRQSGLTGVA